MYKWIVDVYIHIIYLLIYIHAGTYTFWGAAYVEVAATLRWREGERYEKQKKKKKGRGCL